MQRSPDRVSPEFPKSGGPALPRIKFLLPDGEHRLNSPRLHVNLCAVDVRTERAWLSKPSWRFVWLALVLLILVAASQFLPVRDGIDVFTSWSATRGFTGVLLFGAVYVVATVLCLWGALFTIGAGVGFGFWWGIIISWISTSIGCAFAFLIARHLARGLVERWAHQSERFSAVDVAIGRFGWKMVLLLRLNPVIPFNLSNYAFGLTRIGFWPYLLASIVGMLPGTVFCAYLGHVGKVTLTTEDAGTGLGHYAMLTGVLVVAAVTSYIVWLARKALPDDQAPAEPGSAI